jgi:hypothetical protein
MALINSITAVQYSAVMVSRLVAPTTKAATDTALGTNTAAAAYFSGATTPALGNYVEIPGIRDMPALGTPANIVKVPVYGQAQTQSIGAQSDAPDLELTVNYNPTSWQRGTGAFHNTSTTVAGTGPLGNIVADGNNKVFQVALLAAKSSTLDCTVTGLGTVPNALIYFVGKVESLLVTPARDDAMTATVALSIQSDFYGPYTI